MIRAWEDGEVRQVEGRAKQEVRPEGELGPHTRASEPLDKNLFPSLLSHVGLQLCRGTPLCKRHCPACPLPSGTAGEPMGMCTPEARLPGPTSWLCHWSVMTW